MSHVCQLITHLQLCTRKDTVSEEMLVIYEPAHVVVGLQLLEMSSITNLKQTILNVCTRYIFFFFFRRNISEFTDLGQ